MSRRKDPVEEAFRKWKRLSIPERSAFTKMIAIQDRFEDMTDEERQAEAVKLQVYRIAASAERIRKPPVASVPKRGRPPGSGKKQQASAPDLPTIEVHP